MKNCRNTGKMLSLALFMAVFSGNGRAQANIDDIEALIRSFEARERFSGVVLVAQNDKVLFRRAYGLANREWEVPNTVDTKFRIKTMLSPHVAGEKYSYGWYVEKDTTTDPSSPVTVCSHGGGITQFNNLVVRRIEERILIVIFSNIYGTRLGAMSRGINNILHNKPAGVEFQGLLRGSDMGVIFRSASTGWTRPDRASAFR